MKKWITTTLLALGTILLTACGGAVSEQDKIAQVSADIDSITAVQRAVDEFQADTGVLPIKDSNMDTDAYIKYQIDFSKLAPKYLAKSPANSFEQGGIFQYVLWDVENDPTVKLIDLRIPEKMRELNIRQLSKDYPAFGAEVGKFVYKINYEALGFDAELSVQSPYTTNLLPLVVTGEGDVFVDYTLDLQQALEKSDAKLQSGDDARELLITEDSYFLPAYSLPYTVNEKQEIEFAYDAKESMEQKRQKRIEEYEKKQQEQE
ncbi:MAG: hypothetical protein ABS882_09955 [Lysinibacillus sp.]